MAIAAHFEESAGPAGKPRDSRRKLLLEAQSALASGGAASVLVHNVSASGLLLESPVSLAIDEKIGVELPHAGTSWAKVVWASGNLFGCQFEMPISAAALSAAQLRSAAGLDVDVLPRGEPLPDASFGVRLQHLRKQRGLSQSQIAAALGVSKPTVWAWEHGRSHPVNTRIAALAEALGVPDAELLPGPNASVLDDLIATSRQQIASAVGTSPEKVRIWIEL